MPGDEYTPKEQPLTPGVVGPGAQPQVDAPFTTNDTTGTPTAVSTEPLGAQPSAPLQPQETVSGSAPLSSVPIPPLSQAPKKSMRKIIFLIAIPIILLGLIGGAVYAYTIYQKPENVVLDATQKALSAARLRTTTTVTSDFAYESSGTKLSFNRLTFTTGFDRAPQYDTNAELVVTYNDKTVSLKADALVVSEGAVYFRVSNLKDSLEKVLPSGTKLTATANEYLAKLDGKWAKYSLDDLKKDNPKSEKVIRCALDVYKKYKNDKKSVQEISTIYKANAFLVVGSNPVSKDGKFGYEVSVDNTKSKAFAKAVDGTAMSKEINACDSSTSSAVSDKVNSSFDSIDTPVSADAPKTVATVWISQWGHELRAIDTKTTNITGPNDKKVTVSSHTDIDFTQGVATTVPASTTTVKDWGDAAGGVVNELMGNTYATVQSQSE